MPYVTSKGIRIHYEVEGDGPPLVLLHGFAWKAKNWYWAGYVDALKPYNRLILVDARGHGESDKPYDPTAYTLSLHVGDVIAVLDALNLRAAQFWGYSMGGGSALVWRSMRLSASTRCSSVVSIRTPIACPPRGNLCQRLSGIGGGATRPTVP